MSINDNLARNEWRRAGYIPYCRADEWEVETGENVGGEGQVMEKAGKGFVQARREWLALTWGLQVGKCEGIWWMDGK
ncbi:hypothetical protein VZT92_022394 [Zoarces viviparus]|uniref:Uncharacterized protein n=1 Tax=Zoarces viviparus TaxID=48416 RepID=A0AAW1EBY0_ZOAVI